MLSVLNYAYQSIKSLFDRRPAPDAQAIPTLPNEIALEVLKNLSFEELNQFSLASRACRKLRNHDQVWKKTCAGISYLNFATPDRTSLKKEILPHITLLQFMIKECFVFQVFESDNRLSLVIDNAVDNPYFGSSFVSDEEIDAFITLEMRNEYDEEFMPFGHDLTNFFYKKGPIKQRFALLTQIFNTQDEKEFQKQCETAGFKADWSLQMNPKFLLEGDTLFVYLDEAARPVLKTQFCLEISLTDKLYQIDQNELVGIKRLFDHLETLYELMPNLLNDINLNMKMFREHFGIIK